MTDTWTAIPGIIQSYDATALTVQVQPAIQILYTGPTQQSQFENLPVLPDVPVVFPRGGGYELTFPIQAGDECLIVFSSRCIDNWQTQGGIQNQYELRLHDLNDGFAIVGPWSQKTKISNVSTTTVQLRSDDGKTYAELNSKGKTATVIVGGTSIVVDDNSNTTTITGNLVVTKNITCDEGITAVQDIVAGEGGADQISLQQHQHGTTGNIAQATVPPTPGT